MVDEMVSDEMVERWTSAWRHNDSSLKEAITHTELRQLNKSLTKLFVNHPEFLKLVTPQFIQQLTWKEINLWRESDAPATRNRP